MSTFKSYRPKKYDSKKYHHLTENESYTFDVPLGTKYSEICTNCGHIYGEHYPRNGEIVCPDDVIFHNFPKKRALSDGEINRRKFNKFLYDNDALESFYKYISYCGKYSKESVKYRIKNGDFSGAIVRVIYWCNTDEGYNFWNNLLNKINI